MTILPQFEQDLLEAARSHLPAPADHPRVRRVRRVRPLAPLPALLSIAVAVAVAAVAITAGGHGRVASAPARAASVHATRARLIENFGIFRRPQTRTDLEPEFALGFLGLPERLSRHHARPPAGFERALARWGDPKLDRSLVRAVEIPAWRARLTFEPATFQPSASSRTRSEGLDIELWTGRAQTIPPSTDDGTGPRPASVGTLLAHGLTVTGGPEGRDIVFVVPDGVARVTLGPVRLLRPPLSVDAAKFGTLGATVHDNVAAFRAPLLKVVTNRRVASGLFGVSAIAQTVWFGPTGNVVRHGTTGLDLLIRVVGRLRQGSSP